MTWAYPGPEFAERRARARGLAYALLHAELGLDHEATVALLDRAEHQELQDAARYLTILLAQLAIREAGGSRALALYASRAAVAMEDGVCGHCECYRDAGRRCCRCGATAVEPSG